MRLASLAKGDAPPVPLPRLQDNAELARDIQGQLGAIGLLDPPVDGQFGPVSRWALSIFLGDAGFDGADTLDRKTATALLEAAPRPLRSDSDALGARIVAAMLRRGYWIARYPRCVNIVYVEGIDPDGKPNGNKPDRFNDARVLLRIAKDGTPEVANAWEATTEPGRHYTDNPMNPQGAARVALSQVKAWIVGTHMAGTDTAHEALVQAVSLSVHRDLNRDFSRDSDKISTGLFGINQHHAHNQQPGSIGQASAGCLVGRTVEGHRTFMSTLKADARFGVNKAYRFMTAILPVAALSETYFDPSTRH